MIGEAQLLEANALNFQGLPRESRATARAARESFVEAGDDNFALAIVDYYEGSAASFEKQWADARSLLRRSLDTFRLYGQENWAGRSEASLATLLQNKGQDESSLHFFDLALAHLDPETEGPAYGSAWVNKAFSLLLLRRLDAAKAAYAKGIALARRFDLKVSLFAIRYGLALIDLETGQTLKALNSFKRIAEDAAAAGFAHRVVSAELRVAECLGRLGQRGEMVTRVRALHRELPSIVVEYEAPLRELFADAENADVTSELVAHVVEYIEARERGVQKAYRPFRLVKGGK